MSIRYLAVILSLLLCSLAWGGEGQWRLGEEVGYAVFEDRHGEYRVEQVAALPNSEFRRLHGGLSAGYSNATFWLRIQRPTQGGNALLLEIFPSYLDEVELYEHDGAAWRSRLAGDAHPYAERTFAYRNFVFPLTAEGSGPLYLRVRSSSVMVVRGTFWTPQAFADAVVPESLLAGGYFGMAGLSVLLALVYGLWLRSRVFLTYALCLSLAASLVAGINGYLAQVLPDDQPWLSNHAVGVLMLLTQGGVYLLLAELLETQRHFPRFHRLLRVLAVLATCAAVIPVLGGNRFIALPALTVSWLVQIGAALVAFRHTTLGTQGMRVILTAIVVHVLALVPNLLMLFGILHPGFWSVYGWQAEILLHMLVLHGAMIWRLHYAGEENERRLRDALTASQKTEKALDARVAERTADLTAAQHRLEFALASERRLQLEQRQFMSMVSHEFRTPLAIINSVIVNLSEFPPTSKEEMAEHGEQVLRATRRLARLVDNCLTDERLDQAAFSPQMEAADPTELAREAAEIVEWSARHRLQLELDGLPPAIVCDATLVRIALSNLLDNAVKYSEEGTITLRGSADEHAVKFSVSDQGPGLRQEDAERIFERFARCASKKVAGAGLGLYVVRRIARLHGGDVAARNGEQGGAVFEFEILRSAE